MLVLFYYVHPGHAFSLNDLVAGATPKSRPNVLMKKLQYYEYMVWLDGGE